MSMCRNKIILFLAVQIFLIIGMVSCSVKNGVAFAEHEYLGFKNWEKIVDSRFLNFNDHYNFQGPVKLIEVYVNWEPTQSSLYELYLRQRYSPEGNKMEEYWFPNNSDDHYSLFKYDNDKRIVKIEEYNMKGDFLSDISKNYEYITSAEGVCISRELYQNGVLIQTESEVQIEGGYKLVIDNKLYGKTTYEVLMRDNLLETYVKTMPLGSSNITKVLSIKYDSKGNIAKVTEYSSVTNKNIFETIVEKVDNSLPSSVVVYDLRNDVSNVLYRYEISEYDDHNNWLMLDTYSDKGVLIQRVQRKIEYH